MQDRLALLHIPSALQSIIAYEQVSSGSGVALAPLSDYPEAQSLAMFYFAHRRKWMLDEFKRVVNHLREQYAQGRFVQKVPIAMSDDDAQVKVWNEWMGSVVTLKPNAKASTGPVPSPDPAAAGSGAAAIARNGVSNRYPARTDLPRMRRSASAMAALQKLYDDVAMSPIADVKETALVIGYIINGLVDLGIARMQ